MEKELELNGKKFISAKRAAEISGYSSDYVGQLIRAQKISGTLVGSSWYVDKEEILNHKKLNHLKTTKKENKNKSVDFENQKNISDQNKKKSKKLIELAEKNQYFVMGLGSNQSRKAEIDLGKMLYIKDEAPLFVEPLKKFDVGRGHYEALEALKKSLSKKASKSLVDKLALGVSTLSMLVLVFWSFASLGSIDFEKVRELGPTSAKQEIKNVWNLYGESVVGRFGLDKKDFADSVLLGDNLAFMGSAFLGWEKVSDWFVDTAKKIAMPWIRESWIAKIEEQKFIQSPDGKVTSGIEKGGQTVVSRTVVVENSDKSYIDSKIAELKNYFLTSPTAPNVTRYYITNQNDSIVDTLSRPITSLSDVTISGNSSFAGSAGLTTLSVSSTANFTGSSTMSDLTVTEWLNIGTTTQYEALTLDGALYLGTNTAPTNTTYRLYNTNNGDLYWNGSLMAGATVGNWTTDGTNVWRTGGNVGVGTTSPFASLSVVGDAFITRNLTASNITATGTLNVSGLTTLGYASSTGLTVSGSTYLATASGNVGIGTTGPTASLHVVTAQDVSAANNLKIVSRIQNLDNSGATYWSGMGAGIVFNTYNQTTGGGDMATIYGINTGANNDTTQGALAFHTLTSGTLTEKVRIDTSGNVGIGTTGPGSTLHVVGGEIRLQNDNSFYSAYSTAGGRLGYMQWNKSNGNLIINNENTGGISLFSNGSERVTIKNDGNVGIGTTTPGNKLDVFGSANVSTAVGIGGVFTPTFYLDVQAASVNSQFKSTTATNNAYTKWVNGSNSLFMGVDSSVGGTLGTNALAYAGVINSSLSALQLAANNSVAMTISTTGNVGIGTTGPGSALHVVGGEIRLQNNNSFYSAYSTAGARLGYMQWNISNGNLIINNENTGGISLLANGSERVTIKNDGNVGIGTTGPAAKLDITQAVSGAGATNTPFAINHNTSYGLRVEQAWTSHLDYRFITKLNGTDYNVLTFQNGNVGIGTTTPGNKLDVFGSANVSTAVGIGGVFTPTFYLDVQAASVNSQFKSTTATNNAYTKWVNGSNSLFMGVDSSVGGTLGTNALAYAGVINSSLSALQLAANNSVAMTISTTGNVGIGTTSPTYKLAVQQTSEGNTFQIYDTDGNCLLDPDSGGITTTCSSDARLKTNIEESNSVIEYLRNIPIKDFTVIASGDRRTGVIAQEMLVDYPELVHMGPDGYYGVSEVSSWKIIKGLQEQQTMIEDLQSGQADIVLVEQRLTALEVDAQATSTTLEGGGLSLVGRIMAYFKGFGLDIQNGFTRISKVFVGSLHIEGDVCVDDTCVTKDQFKEMILRSGVGAVQIITDNSPQITDGSGSGFPSPDQGEGQGGVSTSTDPIIEEPNATTTPVITEPTPTS